MQALTITYSVGTLSESQKKARIDKLITKYKKYKKDLVNQSRSEKLRLYYAEKRAEDKKNTGKKSRFKKHHCVTAQRVLSLGGSTEDVCDCCGISMKTFYRWKLKYDKFNEAVRKGLNYQRVERLEKALMKRAEGFSVDYEETVSRSSETGSFTEQREKTKVFAPDTKALMFALSNWAPEHWQLDPEPVPKKTGPIKIEYEVLPPASKDIPEEFLTDED